MTRKDEITIASCAYGSKGSSIDFEAGAKWADSNPKDGLISLSWVWHDSSEIPQHDALILFQSTYGDILLIRFQDRKSSMATIQRWAYVDDLLPKEVRYGSSQDYKKRL